VSTAQRGFTLVEVLVALAIVAIALAAGLQATSALTRNAERQTDVVLAHLCAENQLAQQMPSIGDSRAACEQAGRSFMVQLTVSPTPNPQFRRADAQVFDAQQLPVLRLSTIVGRY
jgi:general secretion pathway protein I